MRPQPWHIVVIVLVVVLLFGAGKLPSLARNLGKSMRIFKSEVEELRNDDARKRTDDVEEDVELRRRAEPVREHEVRERDLEPVRRTDEDRYRRD